MVQRRSYHGHAILLAHIRPRTNSFTGRGRGAVPALDAIESWGYDVHDPAVLRVLRDFKRHLDMTGEIDREVFESMLADGAKREDEAALRAQACVVYFIRGHERVKIGTTSDLPKRLAAMAQLPDTVMATLPGSYDLERQLHQQWAHCRIDQRSEWFHLTDELMAFIESIKAAS